MKTQKMLKKQEKELRPKSKVKTYSLETFYLFTGFTYIDSKGETVEAKRKIWSYKSKFKDLKSAEKAREAAWKKEQAMRSVAGERYLVGVRIKKI